MRAAGDQAKTACGILQLCAGLEAGIEGANHAVEHRQRERNAQELEEEIDEASEEERMEAAGGVVSVGGAGTVRGIWEVTWTPGEQSTSGEGGGGVSDEIRTAMEGMEVGGDEMDRGEAAEVDKEDTEAEVGGLGGGIVETFVVLKVQSDIFGWYGG